MRHKPLPPLSLLQLRLSYDPETGVFSRKVVSRKSKVGTVNPSGYLQIGFDDRTYLAHRLAWLFATGSDPLELTVDHINRAKTDNRFANLRLAGRSLQNFNRGKFSSCLNGSGVTGVRFNKKDQKWVARGDFRGKRFHLGSFLIFEDAVQARRRFEEQTIVKHCD